ncbi:YbbR-like domain-containing protein [Paenalkalicoccus suaedae]|uniref:YbbR-like domain-containing protein n=1 Tax=Paenalkalicoccus suaedae TaxID=2592382 RepID=A0A859FA88_9BACI|nr:CdaR family protein [Paenalkalicoccus suaedae]QKS69827.1 YbbR-like domain-containing protein [Paenalkalicoccus suaedae]
MDKLFAKKWFIKLSSIVIAVMLFLMVNLDNANNQPGGIPGITEGSRTMEDVPLNIYYDEEAYVLTDAPETVQVTLRGPETALTRSQILQGQQELYIDLEDREAGVHYERVQFRGYPNDVRVSVVPMSVRIEIQERQTSSFPVEVEIVNEGEIEEGYVVGTPTVEPSTVDVTAASGVLEQVASARVTVDLAERSQAFTDSVAVELYDSNGRLLEVNASPPAVEVTVPITSPNKEVPVRVGRNGALPEGLAIDSLTVVPEMVTIFGPVDIINGITFIDVPSIDLDDIEGDTQIEVDVPVPEGVERVEPEQVTVDIETTTEEERVFSDFEIELEGQAPDQLIFFDSPLNGELDLVINGSPDILERLERSNLRAYINVEGLEPGEYNLPIQFSGPQNIRFAQMGQTVEIIVSDEENEQALAPSVETNDATNPEDELEDEEETDAGEEDEAPSEEGNEDQTSANNTVTNDS